MARDGTGNYSLPEAPFEDGDVIDDDAVNSDLSDIATELTNSWPRDGQAPPTANIPMGSHKFTGLAVGTNANDSVRVEQLQSGAVRYALATGTANAIAAAFSPAITAYAVGQEFNIMAAADNTGATTLNVNGLGAGSLVWPNGTALAAGEIPLGAVFKVTVSATTPVFHLQSVTFRPAPALFTASGTGATAVTQVSLNQKVLYPQMFGAVGNGTAPDDTAFTNWHNAQLAARMGGHIPTGLYKLSSQKTWDLGANTDVTNRGLKITGDGPRNSVLVFDNGVAGPNLYVTATSGVNFYSRIEGIGVEGNTDDVVLRIGAADFSNAFNSAVFDFVANNNSNTSNACAVELNFLAACYVRLVANGAGLANGTAVRLRQGVYNPAMSIQAGNALKGLHITGGSTYGNTFDATLLEVVGTGLTIDVVNAFCNMFIGGSIAQVDYAFDISNGNPELANVWMAPVYGTINTDVFNLTGTPSHSLTLLWPSATTLTGTPAVPASTVPITNDYGEAVDVYITGGAVSAVVLNGATVHTVTNVSVRLNPGHTLALTYTILPGWTWIRCR